MTDPWVQKWNDRYAKKEYAFGEKPNEYLKEQIDKLHPPGSILFGAEGEGRNAVYAAKLGWSAFGFDISSEGKRKALLLAQKNGVSIDYRVGELPALNYAPEQFDAIALIYAHFPPEIRSLYHRLLDRSLRKGGVIIFEAFGKNHLEYRDKNPKIGGPNNLETLFSIEELQADFLNYEVMESEECEIELSEGLHHNGTGFAVRFVARKK